MGFLKRFFRNVFHEGMPELRSGGFEHVSEQELEAHLRVVRYGDFTLTEAVRPSYHLEIIPQQGYRHDLYRDEQNKTSMPVLMASASKETLFETFMDLLDPLGQEVDVVLETSHSGSRQGHVDLYREHIDLPVLKSTLWDFEELLLNDGCAGIAVINPGGPIEVQFDEHKLLIIYGRELSEFERLLNDRHVLRDDSIRFITEAEHIHSSSDAYVAQFEILRNRLGIDGQG
jgi:hypothetical protein